MSLLERTWQRAKQWRTIPFGPVAVFFRAGRRVRVSGPGPTFGHSRSPRAAQAGFVLAGEQESPRETPSGADAEVALLVGVGPGFGFALARTLAESGMRVVVASRRTQPLESLVQSLRGAGHKAAAHGCDATDERSVQRLMEQVGARWGVPSLVVYSVQGSGPGGVVDVEVAALEEYWRQNCLGGFIVARDAARRMLPVGRGTIVLVGSTSSLVGRAGHLNLAVGKFGLRAVAQVLAREVWNRGIHVVHLLVDADIREDDADASACPQSDPRDIAETVLQLHRQKRSAWTSELDVRPHDEQFWEHC